MKKMDTLNWRIERLESDIKDTKEQLAKTLHMVATTFEYTANQIDTGSERWHNDGDYVEHNCNWIREYSKRIERFEHDLDLLKQTRDLMLCEE